MMKGNDVEATASVFQSDLPIDEKLDRARTELLDISARNRLLNMPRSSKGAKAVEVVDEVSGEVFRLLVGHPWRGVGLSSILPTDVERLEERLADLSYRSPVPVRTE